MRLLYPNDDFTRWLRSVRFRDRIGNGSIQLAGQGCIFSVRPCKYLVQRIAASMNGVPQHRHRLVARHSRPSKVVFARIFRRTRHQLLRRTSCYVWRTWRGRLVLGFRDALFEGLARKIFSHPESSWYRAGRLVIHWICWQHAGRSRYCSQSKCWRSAVRYMPP